MLTFLRHTLDPVVSLYNAYQKKDALLNCNFSYLLIGSDKNGLHRWKAHRLSFQDQKEKVHNVKAFRRSKKKSKKSQKSFSQKTRKEMSSRNRPTGAKRRPKSPLDGPSDGPSDGRKKKKEPDAHTRA